jgi:hypothetical protein
MLDRLQDQRGQPSLRTRALAGLIVIGLVVLSAPLIVVPVVGWLSHHL